MDASIGAVGSQSRAVASTIEDSIQAQLVELDSSGEHKRELSGSAEIIFHLKDDFMNDVTVHESTNPDEFSFKQSTATTKSWRTCLFFSGLPDEGDGQLVALYSAEHWGIEPYNMRPFTGDGS